MTLMVIEAVDREDFQNKINDYARDRYEVVTYRVDFTPKECWPYMPPEKWTAILKRPANFAMNSANPVA